MSTPKKLNPYRRMSRQHKQRRPVVYAIDVPGIVEGTTEKVIVCDTPCTRCGTYPLYLNKIHICTKDGVTKFVKYDHEEVIYDDQ